MCFTLHDGLSYDLIGRESYRVDRNKFVKVNSVFDWCYTKVCVYNVK